MHLGIHSKSLSPNSIEEAFRLAAQSGADGVEVAYSTNQEARPLRRWEEHARMVSALAGANGLAVSSLNLSCLCNAPSLIGTGEVIDGAVEFVTAAISAAAAIGAPVVLLPFFGKNTIEVERELQKAGDALGQLVEPAEEAGVILGVESTLNFNQQRFLLDQLGHSDNVRICLDTGDALAHKFDAPTGIRELGGDLIIEVHLKDVRVSEGAPPDFNVDLGKGNVDFRAVAQAINAIGFNGWVILETPPGLDPLAAAKANLQYAREALTPTR